MRLILCGFVLCYVCNVAAQETTLTTPSRSADAYTKPYAGLTDPIALKTFQEGRTLFRQVWTIQGGEDQRFSGLGPLYSRFSCVACHPGNGRGFAPDDASQSMKAMLVRLSVHAPLQGTLPHPVYGEQLNEFGIPGVTGEGVARVHYDTITITLADGETVPLRQPRLSFSELAYGPLTNVLTSARIAPAVFGLGLLDNIPDAEILRQAQRRKPKGIFGRPNRVWDIAQQKIVIGKFGWKANVPNLRQQIASAFHGDLGITSSLFAAENCTPQQTHCLSIPSQTTPELSDQQLHEIQFYLAALAVPQPEATSQALQRGALLFRQAQCIECHTDQLRTGQHASIALLNQRSISPYSDLLLHDMGEGLADHRPDFAASGREWRTPPLWGIGLAKKVHPEAGFLHDGRARTLQEAILWHDAEGKTAKQRYMAFTKEERALLLLFIESL
ncbi:MAG: di-heme oxidoreductase family protein [Methylophilus sp.]|uniref:di-heme oxidoreductase family protein n=1 Tax=Methylophilus sp. TaxID=29541 RepID=UPI003F9F3755